MASEDFPSAIAKLTQTQKESENNICSVFSLNRKYSLHLDDDLTQYRSSFRSLISDTKEKFSLLSSFLNHFTKVILTSLTSDVNAEAQLVEAKTAQRETEKRRNEVRSLNENWNAFQQTQESINGVIIESIKSHNDALELKISELTNQKHNLEQELEKLKGKFWKDHQKIEETTMELKKVTKELEATNEALRKAQSDLADVSVTAFSSSYYSVLNSIWDYIFYNFKFEIDLSTADGFDEWKSNILQHHNEFSSFASSVALAADNFVAGF